MASPSQATSGKGNGVVGRTATSAREAERNGENSLLTGRDTEAQGEAHPEPSICLSQSWSRAAPLAHRELLAEGQILQSHLPNSAGQNEEANQRTKERKHGVQREGQRVGKSTISRRTEFWRGTRSPGRVPFGTPVVVDRIKTAVPERQKTTGTQAAHEG